MKVVFGKGSLFAIVSCLFMLSSGPVLAGMIGVDARSGMSAHNVFATGFAFESFRTTLERAGHTLVPMSGFQSSDLAGLDAVFMKYPYSYNQPGEEAALSDFIAAGHGMVLCADGAGSSTGVANLNAFAGQYGVTFNGWRTEGSGHTIRNFRSHPIMEGVSVVGVDYQLKITGFSGGAVDLTHGTGRNDFIAVNGKAVFLSDSSLFSTYVSDRKITFGDNRKLLTNIADYVAVPEPLSAAMIFTLVPILLVRRHVCLGQGIGSGGLYLHLVKLFRSLYLNPSHRAPVRDRW